MGVYDDFWPKSIWSMYGNCCTGVVAKGPSIILCKPYCRRVHVAPWKVCILQQHHEYVQMFMHTHFVYVYTLCVCIHTLCMYTTNIVPSTCCTQHPDPLIFSEGQQMCMFTTNMYGYNRMCMFTANIYVYFGLSMGQMSVMFYPATVYPCLFNITKRHKYYKIPQRDFGVFSSCTSKMLTMTLLRVAPCCSMLWWNNCLSVSEFRSLL